MCKNFRGATPRTCNKCHPCLKICCKKTTRTSRSELSPIRLECHEGLDATWQHEMLLWRSVANLVCQLTTARGVVDFHSEFLRDMAVSPVNGFELPHWMKHLLNSFCVDHSAKNEVALFRTVQTYVSTSNMNKIFRFTKGTLCGSNTTSH